MGKSKKKNDQELKVVSVQIKVSMHCNACERTVAKTLRKLKGVEKFTTEMKKHKVVVTGKIDAQKVLKKLRKKTGKSVEIVVDKEEKPKDASDEENLTKPNPPFFYRKTNEKGLKTLSFNDKDKIKGKVNSTSIDFLV